MNIPGWILGGIVCILALILVLSGCGGRDHPAEEFPRVHVSACRDDEPKSITFSDPAGNLRTVNLLGFQGPNCEHWNFSTWWKIRIRRDFRGLYYLDYMERVQ